MVPNNELVFGKYFGDHMFEVDWNAETGWDTPRITPFQNLSLHPASSVLHYAIEVLLASLIHQVYSNLNI